MVEVEEISLIEDEIEERLDYIILSIMKKNGLEWWRRSFETSMCEAHRVEIVLDFRYTIKFTCNCMSHNLAEPCEQDSPSFENLDYYEMRAKLKEFFLKYNHWIGYNE